MMYVRLMELLDEAGVPDRGNKADWFRMSSDMIEKFAKLFMKDVLEYSRPELTDREIEGVIEEYFTEEEILDDD